MILSLNVFVLPSLATDEELADSTAVAIDVLRATTSIIHALAAGAVAVVPCAEIEEARRLARSCLPGEVILGGERHGLPIEGFDLGNSPDDYTPQQVGGRTVITTTTNGTRAIIRCRPARQVFIGGFVNAAAVVTRLLGEEKISLLCAGTDGEYSRDDILLAGLLVERLQRQSGDGYQLNAQAITARENWLKAFPLPQAVGAEPIPAEQLAAVLTNSPGGRNLVNVGLDADILTAAMLDRFDLVPAVDLDQMRISRSTAAEM